MDTLITILAVILGLLTFWCIFAVLEYHFINWLDRKQERRLDEYK
jgi:hypothetical protein